MLLWTQCATLFVASIAAMPPEKAPVLAFHPAAPVNSENATALRLNMQFQVEPPLLRFDAARVIRGAAFDSKTDLLYVHVLRWYSDPDQPTGIYTYDLNTGRLMQSTRIPDKVDMSEAARVDASDSWFDLSRQEVFLAKHFDRKHDVIKLSLVRDNPKMIAPQCELALYPALPGNRLLLKAASADKAVIVSLTDVSNKQEYDFPEGAFVWSIVCGTEKSVLAVRQDKDRRSFALCMLEIKTGSLRLKQQVTLSDWKPLATSCGAGIDLAATLEQDKQGVLRIRVYKLPELDVLTELPNPKDYNTSLLLMPETDVLACSSREGEKSEIKLWNWRTGKLLAVYPIKGLPLLDRSGTWRLFQDASGYYLGAFGDHFIRLYAVPPNNQGQPSTGPTN